MPAFSELLEDRLLLAAFITVNSTADNNARDNSLTLREAILVSNRTLAVNSLSVAEKALVSGAATNADADTIRFQIPANDSKHFYYKNDSAAKRLTLAKVAATTAGNDANIGDIDPDWTHSWFSIRPASALPNISDPVVIDGYTQSGAAVNTAGSAKGLNSILKIEIEGENAGDVNFGIIHFQGVGSGKNVIKGLAINRVQGPKVLLEDDLGQNKIQGNYIGLDVSGSVSFAKPGSTGIGNDGIRTRAFLSAKNLIGGIGLDARNLISGNNGDGASGIFLAISTGNVVQGNLIGTDRSAKRIRANAGPGITVQSDKNTVSGKNVICGNGGDGVFVSGANAVVTGNFIGTDLSGTLALGNGGAGVSGNATTQIIANTIAFNGAGGASAGSFISDNSIYSNVGAGIIGFSNVPAPELSIDNNNDISFTLTSTPNTEFRVELYVNNERDEDNFGFSQTQPGEFAEGKTLLESTKVKTNASGKATFGVVHPGPSEGNPFVTATATNLSNNTTSAFSKIVVHGGASFVVSNTGDTGIGTLREAIYNANLTLGAQTITFAIPRDDPRHFYYLNDGVQGKVSADTIVRTKISRDSFLPTAGPEMADPDWPHSWFSILPTHDLPQVVETAIIDGYSQAGSSVNTQAARQPLNAVLKIELDGQSAPGDGLRATLGFGPPINGEGASGSTIQGLAINRFGGNGIAVSTFGGSLIKGNYIGTDVSGLLDLGNGENGIFVNVENQSTIGGDKPAARNLISGNDGDGIDVAEPSPITIAGNLIGWNRTIKGDLSNGVGAIHLHPAGSTSSAGSISVGAQQSHAAAATGNKAKITWNKINYEPVKFGLIIAQEFLEGKDGSVDLSDNEIAKNAEKVQELSAFAQRVMDAADAAAAAEEAQAAAITPLAIDLGGDGVTLNDSGDADLLQNGFQNFPVLTSAKTTSATNIAGTLNSLKSTNFRIDFFANASLTTSGYGPGEGLLGSINVKTNTSGNVSFTFKSPQKVQPGRFITALATRLDASLNTIETSEFSKGIKVTGTVPAATLAINNVKKAEGDSGTTAFTYTVTRSGDTSKTATVSFATAHLSAKGDSDYVSKSGSLTFAPGETTRTIKVSVFGDTKVELDEKFKVVLSGATNATIVDDIGIATILNDD